MVVPNYKDNLVPSGMGVSWMSRLLLFCLSLDQLVLVIWIEQKNISSKGRPLYHSFKASWASPTRRGPKECHCLCEWKAWVPCHCFYNHEDFIFSKKEKKFRRYLKELGDLSLELKATFHHILWEANVLAYALASGSLKGECFVKKLLKILVFSLYIVFQLSIFWIYPYFLQNNMLI